jgi:hypothetical protein
MSTAKPNLYCVIFRTGGTVNYQWHRTIAFATKAEAELVAEAVHIAGYVAHVEHFGLSQSVDLPDSYAVGGGPIDSEDWIEYEDREDVVRSMGRVMDDQPEEN